MRLTGRALIFLTLATVGIPCLVPTTASAAVGGSDGPGGSVTVGASTGVSTEGAPGGASSSQASGGEGANPWVCTSTPLTLNDGPGFAPGGPTPGGWYSVTCTDQETGVSTTATEWIADQSGSATPAVDPHSLALRAENSLRLPAPSPQFNPPSGSVVNFPTWLWIDAATWHSYTVTATVGTVGATAVATPASVSWSMGDGGSVLCHGPGKPFDPNQPADQQSTPCAYVYAVSSAGQPSPDGRAEDDSFTVMVTIDWSVSWFARGASGGGSLPALTTSATTYLRVEQVESVNSLPNDGGYSGRMGELLP